MEEVGKISHLNIYPTATPRNAAASFLLDDETTVPPSCLKSDAPSVEEGLNPLHSMTRYRG